MKKIAIYKVRLNQRMRYKCVSHSRTSTQPKRKQKRAHSQTDAQLRVSHVVTVQRHRAHREITIFPIFLAT
jgi:hypothetical protein